MTCQLPSARQGYVLNLESSEQGVGVPLTSASSGKVIAAVVLACPGARGTRHRLLGSVQHLKATAASIAEQLR